jgi:hypothetical protein
VLPLSTDRQGDWYLDPPLAPAYSALALELAHAQLAEWQEFVTSAVLQIRKDIAHLRERPSTYDVQLLIERYSSASRQAFESRAILARSVDTLRRTVRDLRRRGAETATRYPDLATPLFANADDIEQRVPLFTEHAKGHQRLVEAYSEALQVLAAVAGDSPPARKLALELTREQLAQLDARAVSLGVDAQDLARAAVLELVTPKAVDFHAVAEQVLAKNAELYRRLA